MEKERSFEIPFFHATVTVLNRTEYKVLFLKGKMSKRFKFFCVYGCSSKEKHSRTVPKRQKLTTLSDSKADWFQLLT